ncbi:DoxX family protein [Mycobacterium sp.]|uniref:DoxX family protein n=1 Tax=Mycobacterium sp. TaxID=1785 RepID=UPI003F9830C7
MSLYVVITVITAIINAAVGIADFIPAGFVLANSAKVHVPRSWLPTLGTLKLAGALGLLVGLGLPVIGIAAATGLVLYFIGCWRQSSGCGGFLLQCLATSANMTPGPFAEMT